MIIDSFYLAWRYVVFHRGRTAVLVASLALIIFLPAGLDVVVRSSAKKLQSRALATPLVLGAKSSQLELTLNSLYFETKPPPTITMGEVDRVLETGYAKAIPLHCRFQVDRWPVVGTNLDYFDIRGLSITEGTQLGSLGDCVVGSEVARQLQLNVGDYVQSKAEGFVNIAGVYPLEMKVVGILAPKGTPDDRAVFVDLKTAWVIEGLGHGHQDLATSESEDLLLDREGNQLTANPKVFTYNRITKDNLASFHFHGSRDEFPISAVLVLPYDQRSSDLLRGNYLGADERVQLIVPKTHIDELLRTVLKVRAFVLIGAALVGLSTLLIFALVIALSLRLRQSELKTMSKLGCSTTRIATFVGLEITLVTSCAVLLAVLLVLSLQSIDDIAIRWIIA